MRSWISSRIRNVRGLFHSLTYGMCDDTTRPHVMVPNLLHYHLKLLCWLVLPYLGLIRRTTHLLISLYRVGQDPFSQSYPWQTTSSSHSPRSTCLDSQVSSPSRPRTYPSEACLTPDMHAHRHDIVIYSYVALRISQYNSLCSLGREVPLWEASGCLEMLHKNMYVALTNLLLGWSEFERNSAEGIERNSREYILIYV